MSTARHPQTDGQSEREIQTLITALRAFCNDHQDDWDDYLDMLELGFNSAVQASTQRSPFELLYGTEPRLPIDVALDALAPRSARRRRPRDSACRRRSTFARSKLLSAQERQKRNADRHRRELPLAVGDQVLLSTEGLQLRNGSNKLCSRFIGPFPVTGRRQRQRRTRSSCRRSCRRCTRPSTSSRLKPYRDGRPLFPTRPQRYDRPPPVADADTNGDAALRGRAHRRATQAGPRPRVPRRLEGLPARGEHVGAALLAAALRAGSRRRVRGDARRRDGRRVAGGGAVRH